MNPRQWGLLDEPVQPLHLDSSIEQAVGKLKRFKRIALRCEKPARNFRSFIALAAALILVKSVHTA